MGKHGNLSAVKYKLLHSTHPKWFCGHMDVDTAMEIAELMCKHPTFTLLDYGCGKGYQYLAARMHNYWGGLLPVCYDPGVPLLSIKPSGEFDGIICTDVLEHIPEGELDEVLDEIVGYVNPGGFIYFKISTAESRKVDDDGRNLHVTVRLEEWWKKRIASHITLATVVVKCTQ